MPRVTMMGASAPRSDGVVDGWNTRLHRSKRLAPKILTKHGITIVHRQQVMRHPGSFLPALTAFQDKVAFKQRQGHTAKNEQPPVPPGTRKFKDQAEDDDQEQRHGAQAFPAPFPSELVMVVTDHFEAFVLSRIFRDRRSHESHSIAQASLF